MSTSYQALVDHLADLHNLNMTYWLLQWDQNTYMPPGGATARAAQMATLRRLRHEMLISDHTARLLEAAAREIDIDDADSIPASMVRVARQDYEYAAQLPADYVARYTQATSDAFEVWRRAKQADDYMMFLPALRQILDLKLEEAELRGYDDTPYDVLLGAWERGMTTAQVRAIFEAHKAPLVELVAAVSEQQARVDDSLLRQPFDIEQQRALSLFASAALGFDYDHWARMDEAPHPFCLQVAKYDIRLTTRFQEDFFNPAFFGTLHETGHGLHGHGFAAEIDGTFLSDMESFSQAVCESQSRTWENLVGRSREFWEWMFPHLLRFFPQQFKDASPDAVYRAVNKARPQFIRVEADELTYNLHIMLRFELEVDLVEGRIRLEDVPDAWAAKFEEYFGITPPDHRQGVLQDIHWSVGGIGAYCGYALGNLLSVQYYNRALADLPYIPERIAAGDFAPLREWLTEHIYKPGRMYTASELTRRVTGEDIQPRDYVAYLQRKFADVYDL